MFEKLNKINEKPKAFEFYTAAELWTNEYTAKEMLKYHLNKDIDVSSRNHQFIDQSVNWIEEKFNLTSQSQMIDFGCGPGLYTNRLARKGINVTGVDFSKNSLIYAESIAKTEKLPVNYIHQNYLEFESENRFDLVTMIICDFCALSPNQRKIMLQKFLTILKNGGKVLLDVYSIPAFNKREEMAIYEKNQLNNFWSADEYYSFQNTFKYEKEKVVLDKYTIIEKDRTREVFNWLQYFTPEALSQEFENAGLKVEKILGNVAGAPSSPDNEEFAIIASK